MNQEKVHEQLFNDPETHSKAIITTMTQDDRQHLLVFLTSSSDQSIPLDSCFDQGLPIQSQKDLDYFKEMLDLFAAMCCSRNYICSDSIASWFPIQAVQFNMWNVKISTKLRAAFSKLMLALYVDEYPRGYHKKPELCRILQKQGEAPLKKREVAQIHGLSSDTGQEVKQTALNLTTALFKGKTKPSSKPTALSSLVPGLILQASPRSDNALELEFSPENTVLFELKEAILNHFNQVLDEPEFNEFTFNLVVMAHEMSRFGLFGTEFTDFNARKCILSPKHPSYSLKDMDFARLLRALLTSLTHKAISFEAKKTSKTALSDTKGKKKRNALTYTSLNAQVMKNPASLADPVVRGAVNLKNYIESVLHKPTFEVEEGSYELETKMEVCRLLHFAVDYRVDFLLSNTVEWFAQHQNPTVTEDESMQLFPPVMAVHGMITTTPSDDSFRCVVAPPIANLDDMLETNGKLLADLTAVFTFCRHYKLQTLLISLIIRLFSQRREMLDRLRELHVLTQDEDIDIYKWTKTNLTTLKHYAEQSEIWLKLGNQSDSSIKDRDEGKMRKVNSILEHLDAMLRVEDRLTEQNLVDRQDMLYYLDVHELLVSLIRDGMHTLGELYQLPSSPDTVAAREKITSLFTLCHRVLRRMVEKNPRNQRCLHDYLHIFTSHLNIDVEQIPLICEIYRNNLELCLKVKFETLHLFVQLIFSHGRQPRFLELFEVVQVAKGKSLPDNQRAVLNLFLGNEKLSRYLLYFSTDLEYEFSFEPAAPHVQAVAPYEDKPFLYHAKLFKVLMLCGYGTNRVYLNEAKCQKAIPLKTVFGLLEKAEDESSPDYGLWSELHLPLLNFFFHIFLDTEKLNEELIGNAKFVRFLRLQERKLYTSESFSKDEIELFSVVINILNHYTNNYVKSTDEALMADQEDLVALKSFASSFKDNLHKFQGCVIELGTLTAAQNFATAFEVNKDLSAVFTVASDIDKVFKHDSSYSSFEYYGDNKRKWELFRKELLASHKGKLLCKSELKGLVMALVNCQDMEPSLTFPLVVKTIIDYLRNSVAESAPVSTVLDIISVLNYMIKSDPEHLKERQELMNSFGATRVILALMSERNLDEEVYKALLDTAVKLMNGGNEIIQNEFYMFFINLPSSEIFFERLHSLLNKEAELLTTEHVIEDFSDTNQVRVSLRLIQLCCENHNLNLQNYIRQQTNSRNSYDLVSVTVKLLAALMKRMLFKTFHVMSQCFDTLTETIQGPCVPNQNTIIDGLFLEIATTLMSYDESAERPSKYPSLVSEGVGFPESTSDREYLTGWMIAHLKYKCLITVHSLMEGRTDSTIITRVIRAINLEILKENLLSFYIGFEREYGEGAYDLKMFGMTETNQDYDLELFNNPQDEQPEHFAVVIENAFFIYHLMRKFQDTDDPENKQLIDEELPELAMQSDSNGFMPFRLLGDLSKLGLGLVKQGVKSLTKVSHLMHLETDTKQNLAEKEKKQKLEEIYNYLQSHTGSIEIVFNDNLCKVYFPLPSSAQCLTNDMIERFHNSVDRSTDKSKLQCLVKSAPEINEEMAHEHRLQKFINTSWLMAMVARNLSVWKDLSFVLTLMINFFILTSFSSYGTDRLTEYSFLYYQSRMSGAGLSVEGTKGLIIALGLTQIIVTSFIVVFFLIKVGPLYVRRGWKSVQIDNERIGSWAKVEPKQAFKYVKKVYRACIFLLGEIDVLFYLCTLLFSVLGTIWTPLFFSFHLLDVLYRFPSLQNVIRSVTIPKEALFVTFIFLLIIVYFFSIIAYAYFYSEFNPAQCETLLECACNVFDKGFKSNGGIGGYLTDWTPGEVNVARLFYDNAYNILIIIIMMNIVQGLTVDTFALLRRKHERDRADRDYKCFICGLEKDAIERTTNRPFRYHTFIEHNEWKYVQFMGYLEDKVETEYTGIESYIHEKIYKKDVSWFPQQEAIFAKTQEDDIDSQMLKQSEELKNTLKEVEQDVKELNKSLDTGNFP